MILKTIVFRLSYLYFLESQNGVFSQTLRVPVSPFGNMSIICPLLLNGVGYNVSGFPSSPYKIIPFVDRFRDPPEAQSRNKVCRSDGHCMMSFDININQVQLRPFDNSIPECKKQPATWFLSYNGSIPGPTIRVPVGHESLVRFKNSINTVSGYFKDTFSPCLPSNNRTGRPFSVHFHGSASLAPFDGWAEDETCFGEVKDYVYPNNRAGTGWYHDHALHITADNAYLGLAGFKISSSKVKDGGCGEPWNLEDIEDHPMILSDKLIDTKCQLRVDHFGSHEDNLYGDVNLVNGIPFPQMNFDPKWIRFRLLNAAVSRPWLIKIKDSKLRDISQKICRVIATDGGFRQSSIVFPTEGLFIGVAERYEIVCNFESYANQTVYFWNDFDSQIQKDVPYFCFSHLIARATFGPALGKPAPTFNMTQANPNPEKPAFRVLTTADMNKALTMANNGEFHREMVFGRTNSRWTINGETWDTMRVAASDVGQNTWELWKFKSGGSWFHPVHMHLVDFFLVRREGGTSITNNGLRTNEIWSPKDVFYLGPGETIYVLVRFGPHKGDYMFHCHNLIHEDNDMMRSMHIMNSTMTTKNPLSAQPFIVNRLYNLIYNNWVYEDPMLGDTSAKPSSQARTLTPAYVNQTLGKNLYRIFYPTRSDIVFMKNVTNPWQASWCPIP